MNQNINKIAELLKAIRSLSEAEFNNILNILSASGYISHSVNQINQNHNNQSGNQSGNQYHVNNNNNFTKYNQMNQINQNQNQNQNNNGLGLNGVWFNYAVNSSSLLETKKAYAHTFRFNNEIYCYYIPKHFARMRNGILTSAICMNLNNYTLYKLNTSVNHTDENFRSIYAENMSASDLVNMISNSEAVTINS